jgi:hypothetical protein
MGWAVGLAMAFALQPWNGRRNKLSTNPLPFAPAGEHPGILSV